MAMLEAMNRSTYRDVPSVDYSTRNFPSAVASSSSIRGSLAEINPNMIAPPPAFNRSDSRAGSISTVWSSAEIPLFLDSKMERRESGSSLYTGPSRIYMSPPKGLNNSGGRSFSCQSDFMAEHDEREELASDIIDGPQSVSSPPGSEISEIPLRESSRLNRPPPLTLAPFAPPPPQSSSNRNDTPTTGVPKSVSYGSNLTLMTHKSQTPTYPSPSPLSASAMPAPAPLPSPHAHLYQESERYFSSSYSMASPTASQPHTPAKVNDKSGPGGLEDQTSRFSDDDSELSPVKALSPSYSYSRGSRSSADSFVLPDPTDSPHHPLPLISSAFSSPKMIKSASNDGISTSPLRVAVGLSSTMNRPYTSDATTKVGLSDTLSSVPLSSQKMMDGKHFEARNRKYQFLSSAPSLPSKKTLSFGNKLRTVSTPKLRTEKSIESSHASFSPPAIGTRPPGDTNRSYPPRAPSGRFRSNTLGESELVASQDASSTYHTQSGQDESRHCAPSIRRPSSSDALSAFSNRLRRPSRAATSISSHYNSSVTSFYNQSEEFHARMDRTLSGTSISQSQLEASNVRGNSTQPQKRTQRVSSSHGKNKGGWASHLTQGLTLHIEQGTKRFSLKMNYLSYDPFGKPESLCSSEERPVTPGRPKSKNGNSEKDSSFEDSVGLLEFGPRNDLDANSTFPSQLTLDATIDAPILKHLVIGDDVKGDLITRQANLNMSNIGTREVSGSERRGKVTWRFIYGVEECRLASGEIIEGMKTMRPIGFFCSATLLDPSRAKKLRVMNIIRKQIGSHIESMPMNSSATSTPPLPLLQQQPTSTNSSTYHGLPATAPPVTRNCSIAHQASPTTIPLRSSLVPFKMTKPMLEAMAARNRQSSEYSSVKTSNTATTSSIMSTSPREVNSNLTAKSSLLPSPLSSHFPNQRRLSPAVSGKGELAIHRLQPPQQPVTRPRGSSVGRFAVPIHHYGSALGLDIHEEHHESRRVRAATSHVELKRPPTASEEIKQAYLLQSSRTDEPFPTTVSRSISRKPVIY